MAAGVAVVVVMVVVGKVQGAAAQKNQTPRSSWRARQHAGETHRLPRRLGRVAKDDPVRVLFDSRPGILIGLVAAHIPQLHGGAVPLQLQDAAAHGGQGLRGGLRRVREPREKRGQGGLARLAGAHKEDLHGGWLSRCDLRYGLCMLAVVFAECEAARQTACNLLFSLYLLRYNKKAAGV